MFNNSSYISGSPFMMKTSYVIALELLISLRWPHSMLHPSISSALPFKFNTTFTSTIFHYLCISFSHFPLQPLRFNWAIPVYSQDCYKSSSLQRLVDKYTVNNNTPQVTRTSVPTAQRIVLLLLYIQFSQMSRINILHLNSWVRE